MAESTVLRQILLACSRGATRLFRQNVGKAWVGKATVFQRSGTVIVSKGDVLIKQGRVLHAGLCVGSSDLIGWTSVVVTPAMVGQRVAVFAAVEGKHSTSATTEQAAFLAAVKAAGGIAGVARSADEAVALFGSSQTSGQGVAITAPAMP